MASCSIIANNPRNNLRRRGSAMIEFCFLLPWYIFLFIGTFDFGFYSYSLIATANAARVSAVYCSASATTCTVSGVVSNTYACTNYAIGQLKYLPNIGSSVTTCNASPLTVTITYPAAASCPDGNTCTSVTVAYVTPQLIPIPSVLSGQITMITISQTVVMPIL
jgi:Flp pilus assembly protein TadG